MRLHTIDSRSSEMPWKNNHQSMPRHVIFKLQKKKDKEKITKEAREGKYELYLQMHKDENYIALVFRNHGKKIFKILEEKQTPIYI